MARSKLDEHKLSEVELEVLKVGETVEAGPFEIELIHMTHSIPDACAVALTTELGTMLITGDYKFDQTPVGGAPADTSRLAELGRDGLLLLCGDSTNADRPGWSLSESIVGPHLREQVTRAKGRVLVTSFASNIHRVQQVINAAAESGRKVVPGRPLDAQERQHRPLARPHQRARGHLHPAARDRQLPRREARRSSSTGSQGEPLSAAAPHGLPRPPVDRAALGRHGHLLRHADPRQRALGQRGHRPPLPHRLHRRHRRRRARSTPPATAIRRRSS